MVRIQGTRLNAISGGVILNDSRIESSTKFARQIAPSLFSPFSMLLAMTDTGNVEDDLAIPRPLAYFLPPRN